MSTSQMSSIEKIRKLRGMFRGAVVGACIGTGVAFVARVAGVTYPDKIQPFLDNAGLTNAMPGDFVEPAFSATLLSLTGYGLSGVAIGYLLLRNEIQRRFRPWQTSEAEPPPLRVNYKPESPEQKKAEWVSRRVTSTTAEKYNENTSAWLAYRLANKIDVQDIKIQP